MPCAIEPATGFQQRAAHEATSFFLHRQFLPKPDGGGHPSHLAGDRLEVTSAGTHPVALNPGAVQIRKVIGIDISHHCSKKMDEFAGQHFDYIVTVCDRAKESCPIWPGAAQILPGASMILRQRQVRRRKGYASFGGFAMKLPVAYASSSLRINNPTSFVMIPRLILDVINSLRDSQFDSGRLPTRRI